MSYQTYYYNGPQGLGNTGKLQPSVTPQGLGQTPGESGLAGLGLGFLALWLLYAFANK